MAITLKFVKKYIKSLDIICDCKNIFGCTFSFLQISRYDLSFTILH